MSLIDQALKAAQQEKSRLEAESGRPSAPVLVRLRTQPRQGVSRNVLFAGTGAVVTVAVAILWLNSTNEAPLPSVPPVTSTILTEALASDTARVPKVVLQDRSRSSIADSAASVPPRTGRVVAAAEPSFDESAAPVATAPDDQEDVRPLAVAEQPSVERRSPREPRARQAGTLRISVEQTRTVDATRLFAQAIAAHRAQDLPRARSLYEQLLAISPNDADALNNLGVIFSTERQFDRAEALLRRAVSISPQNAGAWNNIGALMREQGNADEAIAAFRQALAIDPQHQGARVGLAQQYLATHALAQSRELLEDVLRVSPALPEAHYTLGQVLELQGDRVGAVTSYSAFIRFAPSRLASHVELVRRRVEALSTAP